MLFNQFSSISFCSFCVDEGKDMETLENVEQKSLKPYKQLALSGSGDCFCSEKMGKSIKKITSKQKSIFTSPSPKSPQARWPFQ